MAHVRIRTSADGETRYQVRWTSPAGTETSRTFPRKRQARQFKARVETRIAAGRPVFDEPAPTVADWLADWLEHCDRRVQAGTMSPTTVPRYRSAVDVHLVPAFGDVPLDELTPGHVDRLLTDLLADGAAPASAAKVRTVLSSALSHAQRHELVDRNVAKVVSPPEVSPPVPSSFSDEELGRLLDAADGHDVMDLLIRFVVLTGLRSSEVRGLTWDDVDLQAPEITVRRGLHHLTDTGPVTSRGKNETSRDTIPISSDAADVLRSQRTRQAQWQLAAPVWPDEPWVFTTPAGAGLRKDTVNGWMTRLLADADVDDTTDQDKPRKLHELRRTWARRSRDAGVPLEDVQRLGRWSTPNMLLRLYAATTDDRLRDAADRAAGGL